MTGAAAEVDPARPRVGLIHHLELNVSDLERSVAFWGWFLESLGYEPYTKWAKGQDWRLGDTYLVFVQTDERHLDVPYHRSGVGLNHLAFHGRSREHVDELTEQLRERGVPVLYADRHPHAGGPDYYAVFFEDPDRIKVELVAPE